MMYSSSQSTWVYLNFQLNTAYTILWHITLGWFAQVNQHSNKRSTTLGGHYLDVCIPHGPKIDPILCFNTNPDQGQTTQQQQMQTKNIFLLVSYTRELKKHVANLSHKLQRILPHIHEYNRNPVEGRSTNIYSRLANQTKP